MTIYTNVESDKLSKTGKYLFWIELSYNYPDDINLAFEDLQPRSNETFNEINVFLHDEAVNDFKSFKLSLNTPLPGSPTRKNVCSIFPKITDASSVLE